MPTISTQSISRVVRSMAAANGYAVLIQLTGRDASIACGTRPLRLDCAPAFRRRVNHIHSPGSATTPANG